MPRAMPPSFRSPAPFSRTCATPTWWGASAATSWECCWYRPTASSPSRRQPSSRPRSRHSRSFGRARKSRSASPTASMPSPAARMPAMRSTRRIAPCTKQSAHGRLQERPAETAVSGDDVRQQLTFEPGDQVLERELAFLEPLQMDGVERPLLAQPRDRFVEVAVLALERLKACLQGFDIEIHDRNERLLVARLTV